MTDKTILKQILLDNRKEIESYRILHRDIDTDSFPCYVFVGVRRAGKSYLLYQKMQQLLADGHGWDEMLYLNFEDERLASFELSDFNTILECHFELSVSSYNISHDGMHPMLFLDEIQNIDGWEKFARRMADSRHSVFITGSNANMLSREVMTTLGGRYIPVEVYPFSFSEYLKARQVPADVNSLIATDTKARIMHEYASYFHWGGMPEAINMPVKRNYLSSTYQKIYLGDICSRNKISNPNLMRLLIRKIAESVKQPISYSRLTKILSSAGGKISIPTTSSYIQYAEDAWLLLRVHNISAAFSEKETNCKYYFIDNGIISLMLTDANTTLLENLVALSLFRKYGHDPENERIFFYNNNTEVDFYIPDEELAIQVSFSIMNSEITAKREIDALTKLPSYLSCKRRVIITYDEENTISDVHGTIEVIPCWRWMLE